MNQSMYFQKSIEEICYHKFSFLYYCLILRPISGINLGRIDIKTSLNIKKVNFIYWSNQFN